MKLGKIISHRISVISYFLLLAFPAYSKVNNDALMGPNKSHSVLKEDLGLNQVPYPKIDTEKIFKLFLKAVEKGQLIVFDKIIDKESIKPLSVEYVYKADVSSPTVKVYSLLNKTMHHPTVPSYQIKGITAIIDQHGEIIETIVHVGD